jgi:outer membrane receptor protein involved in Fe transport
MMVRCGVAVRLIALIVVQEVSTCAVAHAQAAPSGPTPSGATPQGGAQGAAEGSTEEELRSLSLERLLNVRVGVASKKEELQIDAPATVTSYSAEQIRTLEYWTIRDLAEITPGYSVIRGGDFVNYLGTRGVASGVNEKHLVLLDTMPINHARSTSAIIEEQLPLLFAQKTEFLRGPASALYGTGAFSGVINIVTPEPEELGTITKTNFALGFSEPWKNVENTWLVDRRALASVLHRGDVADVKLAIGYYETEPSLFLTGPGTTNRYRDNEQDIFLYYDEKMRVGWLKGLDFGLIYMNRTDGYGESFVGASDPGNIHTFDSYIPYVRYRRQLLPNLRLDSRVKLDVGREKGSQVSATGAWTRMMPGLGFFQYDVYTNDLDALAEVGWDIYRGNNRFLRRSDLIVGTEYDIRAQDGSRSWLEQSLEAPFAPVFDLPAKTYSGYLQATAVVPLLSDLIITAGVRSDNGYLATQAYHNLSPRASLVQKLTPKLAVKAIYATALRAPGIDAVSHNIEKGVLLTGTQFKLPTLTPETIETLELAGIYERSRFSASISFYRNTIMNDIDRLNAFPGIASDFFVNSGGSARIMGVEGEVKAIPAKKLRLTVNGSYVHTPNEKPPFAGLPVWGANFIGDYTFAWLHDLNAALVVKGVGRYTPGSTSASLPMAMASTGGTVTIDATMHFPLARWATIGLVGRNLLGHAYFPFYPDGTTPRPARTVMLSLMTEHR